MQEILSKIQEGIPELIPAAMGFDIGPETLFNHIPEWDSMSSVNLKVFLEEAFGVKVPDDLLEGEASIGELISYIKTVRFH